MSSKELLKIEKRSGASLDVAALILEIRLAWRMMDGVAQTRIDQDKVIEGLQSRVRELEAARVA